MFYFDTYRGSFLALFLEGVVCETFDLESLSGPEETFEAVVVDLNLPVIHKVEETTEVVLPHIS